MTLPTRVSHFIEHNKLAGVWLCSATVVVVARLLHASSPGYDLGIQLQAAHNLLAGHGLSTYQHVAPNLTGPASHIARPRRVRVPGRGGNSVRLSD